VGERNKVHEGKTVNTTVIEGKQVAEYDSVVLDAMNLIQPTPHVSLERLLVGIKNEQGNVYRVIRVSGLGNFLALIEKLRDLGFTDELAEAYGDKQGFDAIVAGPNKS
jgi:hypothetical protein